MLADGLTVLLALLLVLHEAVGLLVTGYLLVHGLDGLPGSLQGLAQVCHPGNQLADFGLVPVVFLIRFALAA